MAPMVCQRCGRDNPEENEFCGRCGTELKAVAPPEPVDDGDVLFCYRHPKTETRLRCGRCERPICTKCVVIGPAGPRCKECSKQNIAFRPGAVVHTAKSGVRSVLRMGPWGIYVLVLLGMMMFGILRGCLPRQSEPPMGEPEYRQESRTESI